MYRVSDIHTVDNITTAIFLNKDIAAVNLFRRAVLSEIDTYCIDIVTFHVNTSPRHDETLALRLGQLIIDNNKFVPPEKGDFKFRIDFSGPGELTTDNIHDLPFRDKTPIVRLRENQRIICDCIVKKGNGNLHIKWRPISIFTFIEVENGFQIKFKSIGMLNPETIIAKGIDKITAAASRPPQTIFSNQLIPNELQINRDT